MAARALVALSVLAVTACDRGDARPELDAGGKDAGTAGDVGDASQCDTSEDGGREQPSCSAALQPNGHTLVACEDGWRLELAEGGDHERCTVASQGDGHWELSCDDGFSNVSAEAEPTRILFNDQNTRVWWAAIGAGGVVQKFPLTGQHKNIVGSVTVDRNASSLFYRTSYRRLECILTEDPFAEPLQSFLVPLQGDQAPLPAVSLGAPIDGEAMFAPSARALFIMGDRVRRLGLPPSETPAFEEVVCLSAGRPVRVVADGRWAIFEGCGSRPLHALDLEGDGAEALQRLSPSVGQWLASPDSPHLLFTSFPTIAEFELHAGYAAGNSVQTHLIYHSPGGEKLKLFPAMEGGRFFFTVQAASSARARAYFYDANDLAREPQALGEVEPDLTALLLADESTLCVIEALGGNMPRMRSSRLRCASVAGDRQAALRLVGESRAPATWSTWISKDQTSNLSTERAFLVVEQNGRERRLLVADVPASSVRAALPEEAIQLDFGDDSVVIVRLHEKTWILDWQHLGEAVKVVALAPEGLHDDWALLVRDEVWLFRYERGLLRIPIERSDECTRVAFPIPERPNLSSFRSAPHRRHGAFAVDDNLQGAYEYESAVSLFDFTSFPPRRTMLVSGKPLQSMRYSEDGHELLWNLNSRYNDVTAPGASDLWWAHVGDGVPAQKVLVHGAVADFTLVSELMRLGSASFRDPGEWYTCF